MRIIVGREREYQHRGRAVARQTIDADTTGQQGRAHGRKHESRVPTAAWYEKAFIFGTANVCGLPHGKQTCMHASCIHHAPCMHTHHAHTHRAHAHACTHHTLTHNHDYAHIMYTRILCIISMHHAYVTHRAHVHVYVHTRHALPHIMHIHHEPMV